jgi:hypothetical protein
MCYALGVDKHILLDEVVLVFKVAAPSFMPNHCCSSEHLLSKLHMLLCMAWSKLLLLRQRTRAGSHC